MTLLVCVCFHDILFAASGSKSNPARLRVSLMSKGLSVGEEIRHLFLCVCVLSRRTICIFCSLNIEMK